MLNKMLRKSIFVLILVFGIIASFMPMTYARSIGDIIGSSENFLTAQNNLENGMAIPSEIIKAEDMQDMSGLLYNTFLAIGIVIAIVMGLIIAIRFMTGSVEEKAMVKETLIPYVAGCIVLFGAFTIWKIILEVIQK